MTEIKAIIIDDEAASVRSLNYELNKYCPEVSVIASFQDPVEALSQIDKLKPDLVFLDIEMPLMNGFEFLQSFAHIEFDVIFVTAYDKFAVRAFEFNAVDYLLKPVLKSKLIQSVKKVAEKKKHHFAQSDLMALMQNINRPNDKNDFHSIAIPTSEGFEMIHLDEITHLQAESNYTWVFMEDDQKYLVSKTLKQVSAMIEKSNFFRAHKSYVVNMHFVRRYVRGRGGYLVLKNDTQIPVSRNQRNDLLEFLNV